MFKLAQNDDFSIFFLNGILLYSKSLPYESALRIAEKFEGGSDQPPKNWKKSIFWWFLGPVPRTVGWPPLVQISDIIEAAYHNFVASHNNDDTYIENASHKTMFFL